MGKLLLMRHGRVVGHESKRFLGRSDIPIDDFGRAQCMWWRKRFAETEITAAYSSTLSRSLESATLVMGEETPVHAVSELREIDLGEWDGMAISEVRESHPEAFQHRGEHLDTFRPPGGECFEDVRNRTLPFFKMIAQTLESGHGNILVVAHAGVNRVLLCEALGMPLLNLFRLDQDYACLNRLSHSNGQWRLHSLNEAPPM